jgi:cytochrome c-type biogenesis protein
MYSHALMFHVATLSLPAVFAAGAVSFLSPCVLPLVPGYVAAVVPSGAGRSTAARSIGSFFCGFLAVFIALGASASTLGSLLAQHRLWLDRVSGALIVVFGLSLLIGAWPAFAGARMTGVVQSLARRRGGTAALGAAFAFSWTPCVGPVLATILALAGSSASVGTGSLLLAIYGLGLAVPFVVVGLSLTRTLRLARRIHAHYRLVEAAGGGLLISIGTLLITGYLFVLNVYAERALEAVGMTWWTSL